MRPTYILVVAGFCLAAAGCSSDAATSAGASSVLLTVHVGLFGGPARPGGGMADSNAPQPNAPIKLTNHAGRVWSHKTGRDGIARFSMRPGRYTINSPTCGRGPEQVTLKAGHPVRVQIECDIP